MSLQRLEGLAKLTGSERYVDDVAVTNGLWGMTVRSPAARGKVREIRFGRNTDWSQFIVVDHRDIPGPNEVFLIERDQPVLAGTTVRHIHEAVVLIAHVSRDMVRCAVRDIEVLVDPEPAVLDFTLPANPDQIQYGSDNVFKQLQINKGDVERALAASPHVIEGEYHTGAQEHVYIEPQGMIAWVDPGTVTVRGSMQCPYYVLNALKHALRKNERELRVIQSPTGGGFGGKEDYPSILAVHAALLSMKAGGRPVKMIYDRAEDMAATTKRHPARIRHRTGVDHDGRLLAQEIDVLMDGGAYVTLSPVVLSRGIIHAAGPYHCENVRINGSVVLTNAVPYGAFRGFGAPQTHFANERHMNVIAERIGIDPLELRRINLLRDGQTTSTGQVINDGTDRVAIMDRAVARSEYHRRRQDHASFNVTHPHLRRGIGLAAFHHGSGFTGSGEVHLASRISVAGLPDGRVEVLSANTEMGQGTTTIFTAIAAQRLEMDAADIIVAEPDTSRVPNSGPTVASRTAMVVGYLIEQACDELKRSLGTDKPSKSLIQEWHRQHPGQSLLGHAKYEVPSGIHWDDRTYRGDAYATFSWAAQVAEVEIDLRTAAIRVIGFTSVQEIGKVLNPTLARGQVQGGVVQGIGWALMEDCRFREGAMINNQLTNYIIPTTDDVPAIQVEFIENAYPRGAQGAKGLGELPIDGPAPAILNAIADALPGCNPCAIPFTPELLLEQLQLSHDD
jgi:CO/xanthine dehydrogenase Mo-binding subunit